MSSTESSKSETDGEPDGAAVSAFDEKLATWAKWSLPIAVVVGTGVTGVVIGPATAVLVLAAGALVGCVAAFWQSLRTLAGETPLSGADAFALGTPRAEEEQKRAVLRALKDLEFERSVGKISDEDYEALVARYRAEAKRLLRVLDADAQPQRQHVEALVAKRLRRDGVVNRADVQPGDTSTAVSDSTRTDERAANPDRRMAKAKKVKPRTKTDAIERAAPSTTDLLCARCTVVNDGDAVFCKKCGGRLDAKAGPASDGGVPS